jgi:ATP-dependent Clp protease ATP-binding subunit ClpC
MFNFEIKKTGIYRAIKWEKWPIFRFARAFKITFFILFLVVFLLFLYGFLLQNFSQTFNQKLLGLCFLFLAMAIIFQELRSFFSSKLKQSRTGTNLSEAVSNPEEYNLAEFLNFETARAAWEARRFCKARKLAETSATALLYFLIKDNPKLNFIFYRLLLNPQKIKSSLKSYLTGKEKGQTQEIYSEDFQKSVSGSFKIAVRKNHSIIETGDILPALADYEPVLRGVLIDSGLKSNDIENLTLWLESLEEGRNKRKKFWEYENLAKKGTLAKQWTAGYTINLDKFSTDWTDEIKRSLPEIVGHEQEIASVERILGRRQVNNVLLVGDAGTGRKSIVYALAKNSLLGQSLPEVNYKRVVELDIPKLLTECPNLEDFETGLDMIFQEAILAGNVILVIDEFHNYIGQVARPGVVDISGIISKYLHLPNFQIVAITTFAGLHQYIEQNPSILALFEKVEVSEISGRETFVFLENLVPVHERKSKKFISYQSLAEIISAAERYLPSLPFPEKAVEILDEAMVYLAANTRDSVLMPSHIDKIITQKTQIPTGELESKEKQILLNLEKLIHERIINQEEAVKEVSAALRRARADVTVRKGPMGGFLFLGPTGVGKTETSKALAEIYFGSEERMIRLDMSEFQSVPDIKRLLGEPGQEGLLTTPVRENPFSLILLDEIEKAHPNILNLFLQVLDEGHLTDGQGRKVDFKNSIIIATSNAGYLVILQALKEKTEWSSVKQKLLDSLFEAGTFRPEFINRFDAVVVFRPLSKENLLDISGLLLEKLKTNLKGKGAEFVITRALKEKIVKLGYDPTFGAREMRRVIQDKVENVLAEALLKGEIKRGGRVEIDPESFRLKINS